MGGTYLKLWITRSIKMKLNYGKLIIVFLLIVIAMGSLVANVPAFAALVAGIGSAIAWNELSKLWR